MTESHPFDPPDFTPVPSASTRRDGWTPERQRRFIHALTATEVVTAAARAVGMTAKSAYKLRVRPGAESFALAWDIACDMAGDRAFHRAIDQATNGIEVPRFYRGRRVATVRRFDYRLAAKILDRHIARHAEHAADDRAALRAFGRDGG